MRNVFRLRRFPPLHAGLMLLALVVLGGCSYAVNEDVGPLVHTEKPYSEGGAEDRGRPPEWWKSFDDPLLDELVRSSFAGNFTLKEGLARIRQARAAYEQAHSQLPPAVDGTVTETSRWSSGDGNESAFSADLGLSWEMDIWKRLSSAEKAALLELEASKDDLQASALLLSAQIADTYFSLLEQKLQLDLLAKQIELNETFLELTTLRFINGASSIVDIYQQRQQLAAIRAQVPLVRSNARAFQHRLYVLLGKVPSEEPLQLGDELPEVPPLPALGLPSDLLLNRPDLRRIHNQLVAADYRVAEAVADRLPRFRLGGSAGYQTGSLVKEGLFLSLIAEAVAPVLDWGERRSEVDRRKAVVSEQLALYTQAYLTAVEEVENALWQERQQAVLISELNDQLLVARANLNETRNRYMQGLSDYLPVLTALQTLQGLERDVLFRTRQAIQVRILLYRALGGAGLLEETPVQG